MRKFRITGVDRDSGFETSIVVEAKDANLAEMEALRRGITARSCEVIVEPNDAATRLNAAMEGYRASMNQPPPLPPMEKVEAPAPFDPGLVPIFELPHVQFWAELRGTIARGIFLGLLYWTLFLIVAPFALFYALYSLGRSMP